MKIPRRSEKKLFAEWSLSSEFSSGRREWCYLLISDSIGRRTRHGRQFSKLGFTVQLVPRYALLVRDQGRAREKGRSNCTILTQSRGCKRHAAPLHSAPRRDCAAPAYYAGLCSSLVRTTSTRLDSTRAHTSDRSRRSSRR